MQPARNFAHCKTLNFKFVKPNTRARNQYREVDVHDSMYPAYRLLRPFKGAFKFFRPHIYLNSYPSFAWVKDKHHHEPIISEHVKTVEILFTKSTSPPF